ncbi:hypothetical protein AVEN_55666-1 [Araneus ventricosus]|uniref:Uncharacterized protein n=1 Tax=Araneus ventricosus TaxID=182803 RepID=A0A4Y2PF91_ARAVE|nr:hypothetical protein AVEN_55666-1 [Araneus ventricosus]
MNPELIFFYVRVEKREEQGGAVFEQTISTELTDDKIKKRPEKSSSTASSQEHFDERASGKHLSPLQSCAPILKHHSKNFRYFLGKKSSTTLSPLSLINKSHRLKADCSGW